MMRLGQRIAPVLLVPCGSHAGYRRHLRHGERPCRACMFGHWGYNRGLLYSDGTPR
jgi:hypothetical protein